MSSFFAILIALIYVSYAQYKEPVKAGVFLDDLLCVLDPRINATTLTTFRNGTYLKQISRYLWETACGRSRGVFTLAMHSEVYEGKTFSCANWPEDWGIKKVSDWFKSPDLYEKHLKYLSLYLQGIYNTTAVHTTSTCDFLGFTILQCPTLPKRSTQPYLHTPWAKALNNKPFRGVNLGGIFVLEPWITPKFTNWTYELADQHAYSKAHPVGSDGHKLLIELWTKWYTREDFKKMKSYGLNSVRLPVGWWYFAKHANVPNDVYIIPAEDLNNPSHPITQVIKMAHEQGLVVVLDLHGAPGSQNGLDNSGLRSRDKNPARWGYEWFYNKENLANTIKVVCSMAKYIGILEKAGINNVVALEILNEPWVFGDMSIVRDFYVNTIVQVRQFSKIPLVIHDAFRHSEWEWLLNDFPFENIFMDTHVYHAFNADDIASSEPNCDKNKIIVAQNIACGYGSMLRFKTCTSLPTFLGEWSLANDDCIEMIRGAQHSVQNKDYGQCKNLKSRIGDPWWQLQYRKFAFKQMATAEREIGWFFWTWKTGPGSESDPSVPYWSYSAAVASGIIPSTLPDQNITEACYVFESTEPYKC